MTYDQSILLTGDQWASLSDGQKVQVLQAIENHSAYEAGRITCPVVDKFLYTGTDGVVLGTYDPQNRVIYVNSSQFDPESKYGKTSETIITTCLHTTIRLRRQFGRKTLQKETTFLLEKTQRPTIINRLRLTHEHLLPKSTQNWLLLVNN